MGIGSTKILSYDEASKRFSQNDLDRIETAFRDVTNGANELNYISFKHDVFCNFLPEKLAARLFQIYANSSRSGVSLKDLICCLAVIYHGSEKERMQLLYALFTPTGILRWHDVEQFLSQCGDQLPEELKNFFENNEIITQEKFLKWLEYHQGHTTTITDWLLDEQRLYELLTSSLEKTSDQYSILAGVTHLSEKEIKELEQSYYQLYTWNNNRQQHMTLRIFSSILSLAFPSILIQGVFEGFDENRDECIDFKEFVCGISAACRGPQFERFKFLFRVFDRDHDGILNYSDVIYMTSCLIEVSQFVSIPNIHSKTSPEVYTAEILPTNDSVLKPGDFLIWCQKDGLLIELLDLIFQTCHVIFGLRPLSQQDEVTIVKHFLHREKYPFTKPDVIYHRPTSKPGASWYLISMDWWLRWEALCTSSIINSKELNNKKSPSTKLNKTDNSRELGDINNSSLIEKVISNDCVQLKPGLRHGIHFEMIPELLWIFLRKYYRCNGPVVCRKVIYRKKINKPELDLYPLITRIYRNQILSPQPSATTNTNNNNSQSMQFVYPLLNYVSASMSGLNSSSNSVTSNTSRHILACSYFVSQYQTVRSLAEELSIKFGKSLEEIRLWMRYNDNDLRPIDFESIDDITCQEAGFIQNTDILLEIRNNDLTWPEELYTLATRSKALAASALSPSNSIGNIDEEGRGQIGLSNLGNTCFLNAAVQCLSHSFPLTFYFLHKYHLFEINKDNPIGMQGNIALCYGQLIAKLWGNVRGPLAPFELRGSVAKFGSSRFTDFQQHDSQEFLSFLLDGLHEDLNRVYDKPYVELKDSDDRSDEDVAHEHWSNHLARNTSIIVDLFHGLLRSQVKCRICEFKSVRFDPFNILSLPLPIDTSIYIEVKLIRLDGSKPIRYGIKLNGELTVDHIKTQLAILSELSIEQIAFFDVTSPTCLRRYTVMDYNHTKIKQLNLRDFVAYELPLLKLTDKDKYLSIYIVAIHRRLERQERYLSPLTRHKILFFGQSIIIPYNKVDSIKITNKNIYENISKQLERLLRKNTNLTCISNHALDCDDSLGQRYPFILKHVKEDGRRCSLCPWNRFCLGCSFESDEKEFLYTNGNIAIEWESSAYFLRYLSGHEQDVEIHSSVKSCRLGNNIESNNDEPSSAVTLEDCLQSFINWENLDNKEMFSCKRCKQLQPADKKLDIWKLPPCLIFHIKRFQLSNNRWIKSPRPVRFPIRSFHPAKFLAPRSSNVNSIATSPTEDNFSDSSSSVSSLSSPTMSEPVLVSSSVDNNLILSPARLLNENNSNLQQDQIITTKLPPPESQNEIIIKKNKRFGRRKKKVENQNDKFNIPCPPKFIQKNDRSLSFGDNSFDTDNAAYNLYAFICHYGVIGGGHYVSFVKNHINQQWYCFNDSSCKPVSESILEQCSSSAYLLFYERESLDHRCYMPNVEGRNQVVNELSLTTDDRWCSLM
ncbi:unnamed protein product [Adineta steineri]|uniref:ubiquitinyl hydrolase 1 n=2 Tax=Adineta steineri TaxID=433720 RepID=A0A814U4A7_9BILA|nr:unnamed protein product [Adineta steineri]